MGKRLKKVRQCLTRVRRFVVGVASVAKKKWGEYPGFAYLTYVGFPTFLLLVFAVGAIVTVFQDMKTDTTSLTNIGAGLSVGFASVCFGWSRAITTDGELNQKHSRLILRHGERMVMCSYFFLTASGLKYYSIHESPFPTGDLAAFIKTSCSISARALFFLSFSWFGMSLRQLFRIAHDRRGGLD